MIYNFIGGTWGYIIRRVLEAAALTLPFLALLWLLLAIGYRHIYPWAVAGVLAGDTAANRRIYLSLPFWLARGIVYWLIWSILAYLLNRWSRLQDQSATSGATTRLIHLIHPA